MSKWRGGVIRSTQITPSGSGETDAASGVWRASDAAYWVKQGSWPSGMTPDTYFPNTTLLLNGDSVNAGQNNIFVDGSSVGSPITRYGNATQGSFTPFGSNWSAYFDGSGDYLQTPASSATTIVGTMNSSTNLTIECWINPTAYNNNSANFPGLIGDMNPTSQVDYWSWGLTSTGTLMLYWYISGSQYRAYTTGTVSLNTWSHIALNISAGAITMYINGVSQAISGTSTLGAVSGSVGYITVGQWNNAGSTGDAGNYTGYISNLRIVKASTYTTSFTPSTTPLTAITSTSLLTCHANRFVDGSSNATTLTRAGNTKITNFGPFSTVSRGDTPTGYYNQNDVTNWSNYFDGTGDNLSISSFSSALSMGTSDFTIEFWVYPTSAPNNNWSPFLTIGYSGGGQEIRLAQNINGTGWGWLYPNNSNNGDSYAGYGTLPVGVWSHIAMVRSGSTVYLFKDGTQVATGTSISFNHTNTSLFRVAMPQAAYADGTFNGYISNLRIVKGTALYTSAFTPPTSALTAISGTSILTCQSRALADTSSNALALTVNGDVTATGFSPFNTVGYNSVYFDGSSDWLATPSDAAFGFGTGDFTIECWMYPTSTKADMRLWNFSGDSDNIDISGSGGGTGAISYYNGSTSTYSSSGVVNFNAWNHVACVRSSGTTRVYLNGVLRVTQATTPNTSARILYIAGQPNSWFEGYISNFRVVKGTAVYTGAFTPPTSPLTAVSGTSLLTCQNSSFKDNSTNAFALTRNGDAKVQTFNPFVSSTALTNCGSMYFDGSGDYLTVANSPINNLGTSDFTIELWFKSDTGSMNTHACLVASYSSAVSGSWAFKAQSGTSGYIQFASYGPSWNDWVTTTNIASDMAWHHCAVTRSGNTLRIFVDGTQRGSWDISAASSFTGGGHPLSVGFMAQDSTSYLNGNISNLRIIKGTALYTSAFTPPTAPVTPTAATTLYLNGMNGAIIDQTALNTLETVGDTKISTSIKKYGTGSIYMDGTSDWLYIKGNENFHFASSNFTMEGWFYFTNATANALQTIFSNYTTWNASGQGTIFWGKHTSSSGYMSVWFSNYNSGAALLAESSMPPSNTWTHYALVRNGNTFTLYRDGVSTASASWSGAATTTAPPTIFIGAAGDATTSYNFPGYIDDFRITKGVARYTSAFTPPTSAHATR